MMRALKSFCLMVLFLATGLSVVVAFDGPPVSVGSAPPLIPMTQEILLQPETKLKQDFESMAVSPQIVLNVPSEAEKSILQNQGKGEALKIGFGRDLPQPYQGDLFPLLPWKDLEYDHVATFSITSPEAKSIRVAMNLALLPEGVEVRFFSEKNSQIYGPYTSESHRFQHSESELIENSNQLSKDMLFWSPVIEGETAGVEIYIPAGSRNDFSVEIPQIQHLVYSVMDPDDKALSGIGSSGACNIDVRCRTTIPSDLSGAVAKIIYTSGSSSYLCTGTLLNDSTGSGTPYFMTANHCLSTQSVANTINSYWFFERATCGGANPTSVTQFSGGASLLATGTNTDFTFLQLSDLAIGSLSGIAFAGWTTTNPTGFTAIGLHHPSGDLKKWSQGRANGFAAYLGSMTGTGSHIHTTWSAGTTEPGSSGSGLFAVTGEHGGAHLFVGNLHGGYASCSNLTAPDWYGRFDLTYPSVQQWLAASSTTRNLTVNSIGATGVSITGNPSTYGGTTNYTKSSIPNNTSITLTAPATSGGANFSSWSGCNSTNASARTCTITMSANKTVTVNYGPSGHQVTLPGVLFLLLDEDEQ